MNFFSLDYWFTLQPPQVTVGFGPVVFGVFVALVLLGIALRILSKQRKKEDRHVGRLFRRAGFMCVVMGFVGMLLYLFGYENIRLFGARFWYPVWVIGFLVWGWVLYRYGKHHIPAMRQEEQAKRQRDKYLPKSKR